MKQQQPEEQVQVSTEMARRELVEERPVRRSLRIDLLEERVAPIALWGE
jgi:hypothetical protein